MITLFDYQKDCLNSTSENNKVAFYLDMGLGKTFVGSEKAMQLKKDVLLICQKSKIQDWKEHFLEYYGQPTVLFDLTQKNEFNYFTDIKSVEPYIKVGFINYDLVFRRLELLKLSDFTLMLDESSLIQNENAKRSQFIMKLNFENLILLSGTPTDGKYEKLWTQASLLGWKISKDTFLKTYVNFKTIETDGFFRKIVDPENPYKNIERLKRRFRENGAIFLKTEEVIELPQQNFNQVRVDKIKEYNQFQRKNYVEIGDTELLGDSVLAKMLRLRQLCGQYSKNKLEAFKDLIESTSDRLIVFYNFNEELEKMKFIATKLERPISELNGSAKDLTAYENEENSITFVQYQAGSMGHNFQKSNKIIYFTLPLKSEYFEQSKKRIHRVGQSKPCFYYLMITKNSIEEDILETLEMRKDYTDKLFEENERKN